MVADAALDDRAAEQSKNLDRLVALSDSVIAVAITLLVLDIAVPQLPEGASSQELGDALWDLRSQVFGFVLSFALIANYWLAHRLVFSHVRRSDLGQTLITLFFLLVIVFVPFAAGLLSEYAPDAVAVAVYAGVMTLAGLSTLAMMVYPAKRGHLYASVSPPEVIAVYQKIAIAPIVFALSIPIAFVNGWVAIALWALIPIGRIAINRQSK